MVAVVTARWPSRLATVTAAGTVVMLAASAGLAALAPTRTTFLNLVLGLAIGLLSAVLGWQIGRRAPGNVVGAALAAVGFTVSCTVTREVAFQVLAERPELWDDAAPYVALVQEGAWWVLAAVALLLLHFPDGRLPSRRWRWVPPALAVSVAANQVYGAFDPAPFLPPLEDVPRPFGAPAWWAEVLGLAFFPMLALVLASAASLVVRFRRSDRVQRRQIKWLAMAGVGITSYPLLCLLEILVRGEPGWFSAAVGLVALAGIPVSVAIAVLRHDLIDIDRALASAVTWGLVSITLVVVYAVTAVTAGLWLGSDSAVAAAAATALCALALSPLRQRLQRLVDRRLYPQRRAAFEALNALHGEVSAGRSRPEELESVLRTALHDESLGVGYRVPGEDRFIDAAGREVDQTRGEPVLLSGNAIGLVAAGSDEISRELLRQVAERATALVEIVRLRIELAQALQEVEASRTRLVQIGFEERRRLEHDLHDGAQQRLVSLGMAIRLAQRHLDDGTVDIDALMDQSVAELGTAVAELRQIAHGIRPSTLDDGLPAALSRLVRGVPLEVDMEVDADTLPDDVATTAYFVISEALTNAVKHAEAQRIGLHVSRVDGHVVVRVTDDGRGGAALSDESGIADRVAALGGSLSVASPRGRGTVVEAEIPCAS